MKKRVVLLLALILLIGVFTTACKEANVEKAKQKEGETITLKDSRGKEVEINYPAEKIVCLLNSGLNDLYMLGAKDQVIAIDKWTYDTEEIYRLTSQMDERVANKTLPAIDKNIEDIVGMNPDVVIMWAGQEDDIKTLEEKGIKVFGIQVDSFDDVSWKMESLGKISGKEARAKEILEYTNEKLAHIKEKTKSLKDDEIYSSLFVWGPTKLDLAGNNSTGNSILELSGATNAAASVNEEHFVAKMEDVIGWNPEAILMWNIGDLDPEDYFEDTQWSNVEAIKTKRVFELPHPFYADLWTVKYVYSVGFLSQSLYPELFEDQDLETMKDEMLRELYKIDFKN